MTDLIARLEGECGYLGAVEATRSALLSHEVKRVQKLLVDCLAALRAAEQRERELKDTAQAILDRAEVRAEQAEAQLRTCERLRLDDAAAHVDTQLRLKQAEARVRELEAAATAIQRRWRDQADLTALIKGNADADR